MGSDACGQVSTAHTSAKRLRSSSMSQSWYVRPAETMHCWSSSRDSFRMAASFICLIMLAVMLESRARRLLHSRRLTNAIGHASFCQPVDQFVAYCQP
eukprot:scaffold12033_cov125-Isochrysis_galbana.AAC.1